MADIQTCAVTAIVHSSKDGPPVAGAQLQLQLSAFDIFEGFVSPPPIRAVTDVNGQCVIDLFPNELGQAATYYKVTITAEGKTFRSIAVVPAQPTALLHEITAVPAYDGKPDGYLVLARLEEMFSYIEAVTPKFLPNAPTNPLPGSRWTDADTGKTYEWVVTASSAAWFETGSAETIGYETAIQAAQSAAEAAASAVDAQAAEDGAKATLAVFASAAPANPLGGLRWTSAITGKTYEFINDGNSGQWVETGSAQTVSATAFAAALATPATLDAYGFTAAVVQDTLDNAKALQSYAAMLAYTGRAVGIRITTPGIDGYFRYNSALTNTTNGLTRFAHASGTGAWERLTSGETLNLKWAGARGDGITDDAPALRKAVAILVEQGSGSLYVPPGRYYLASGDPRGLLAGSDYYTVCEVPPNCTIFGDGDSSVLLYESNRLTVTYTSPTRGDVGALFANFRVRENSNTPYAVSAFVLRDLLVQYTALASPSKDMIDGQVVRIYSNAGAVSNGIFDVSNVSVIGACGHQVFSFEKVERFVSRGCRFEAPGFSSNAFNADFSVYYITGKTAAIAGNVCRGSAPDKNSTFLEIHCKTAEVRGNLCEGMQTFINAVSQMLHPGAAYNLSTFIIDGNTALDVAQFCVDWVYSGQQKANLLVRRNVVRLLASSATTLEGVVSHATSGLALADCLPTINLVIDGNDIEVNDTYGAQISDAVAGSALMRNQAAQNITISNNRCPGSRGMFALATGVHLRSIKYSGNTLRVATRASDTTTGTEWTSRTGLYVSIIPGSTVQRIEASDNLIEVAYAGAADSYGIQVANFFGAAISSGLTQEYRRNRVTGAHTREINFRITAPASYPADSVIFEHEYSTFPAAPTSFVELVATALPVAVVKDGSWGRIATTTARVVKSSGANVYLVQDYGDAAPTDRYWPRGSTREFPLKSAAGNIGVACVTAGSPGTWKTYGAIAA